MRKTFEVDYTASYRLDLHVNDLLSNLIGISNYTVLVILESKHRFLSSGEDNLRELRRGKLGKEATYMYRA